MATAHTEESALDLVCEHNFDIILLNVNRPDEEGLRAFENVKKVNPQAAVIMMTGYSERDLVAEAAKRGAYACVMRPVDMKSVVNMVEEIIRSREE